MESHLEVALKRYRGQKHANYEVQECGYHNNKVLMMKSLAMVKPVLSTDTSTSLLSQRTLHNNGG